MATGLNPGVGVSRSAWGEVDGHDVDLFTLTNRNGLTMKVSSYGAILTNLSVPDRTGRLADVVLGFDELSGYLKHSPYFGATVGRVANRIREARFQLGDRQFGLVANDGLHHLHGGRKGWDKVVWATQPLSSPDGPALKLTYVSPDGDEGYPGTVWATTIYTLTNNDELRIEMSATADTATILNMVNHSYWNLAGAGSGPITEHELLLHADHYTPGDPVVPTGLEREVAGTPFDFTTAKTVGRDLRAAGGTPIGYDHNFVIRGPARNLRPVARLCDPRSGRVMTLEADQPGVQFYSGNFLDGTVAGKGSVAYAQYTGLCLETQAFPNAINVPAWRSQVVLTPPQTYKHTMIHRFTAE